MFFRKQSRKSSRRKTDRTLFRAAAFLAAILLAGVFVSPAAAQARRNGRYFPLDQTVAPGLAARWSVAAGGVCCPPQPIRVELPGEGGLVSFYSGPDGEHSTYPAPAMAAVHLGAVYRLKLSEMPEFPGVELYPTVEMIDRLHPPRGRELDFPVPIAFTDEEIRLALEGRLVTKVMYLEQPDRA